MRLTGRLLLRSEDEEPHIERQKERVRDLAEKSKVQNLCRMLHLYPATIAIVRLLDFSFNLIIDLQTGL